MVYLSLKLSTPHTCVRFDDRIRAGTPRYKTVCNDGGLLIRMKFAKFVFPGTLCDIPVAD